MDQEQEAVRRFINELVRVTGWTASGLAGEAGISHTTLTRFLKGEGDVTWTPSTRTLSKIRAAAAKVLPREQIDNLWLVSQREAPAAPPRPARSTPDRKARSG